MGGGGRKKGSNSAFRSQQCGPTTLRRQCNVNAKTMCKIDHLKNLTVEASVPSLGAFFGERLAAATEALGLRGDPTFFVCERCESILQPGHNCYVRVETNKSRGRHRRKKSNPTAQNNVIYRCHFCSHRNLMRGTPKGYVKEICPPKPKPTLKSKKARENCPSSGNDTTTTETSVPATPLPASGLSLLDSKKRKRNRSTVKKADEQQSSSVAADSEKSVLASSKRRKRSWTSLKVIAENSGQDIGKKLTDLTIPFFI